MTDAHPIIHSDRGCHYRIPDWINLMNEFGYTRSMSRKGCSPDNAACEGFFGILKENSSIITIGTTLLEKSL